MCKEAKSELIKAIKTAVKNLGYPKDGADAIIRELKHSEDKGSLSEATLRGAAAYGLDAAGIIAGITGLTAAEVYERAHSQDSGMSLETAWNALGWGLMNKFGKPETSESVPPISRSQVVSAITSLGLDAGMAHTVHLSAEYVTVTYFDLRDGRKYYRDGEENTDEYAKTVAVFPIY